MSDGLYRVGCAGMFVLGTDYYVDTEDEAIVACQSPPGCEAYNTETGEYVTPICQEEIDEARARLEAQKS